MNRFATKTNISFKLSLVFLAISFGACKKSLRSSQVASIETNREQDLEAYEWLPEFRNCAGWQEGVSWEDFQFIRKDLDRPELIKYVNKIDTNRYLKDRGFPVIPVIFSTYEKTDITPHLKDRKQYVVKPNHMSQGNHVYVMNHGHNLVDNGNYSIDEINSIANSFIDTPSNSGEWWLKNMTPGILIQEYIENSHEFKFQTIWGKAIEGKYQQTHTSLNAYYDIEGETIEGHELSSAMRSAYKDALILAERVSEGTDALRVDIMVEFEKDTNSYKLMINELELHSMMYWPGADDFAKKLDNGYRIKCRQQP